MIAIVAAVLAILLILAVAGFYRHRSAKGSPGKPETLTSTTAPQISMYENPMHMANRDVATNPLFDNTRRSVTGAPGVAVPLGFGGWNTDADAGDSHVMPSQPAARAVGASDGGSDAVYSTFQSDRPEQSTQLDEEAYVAPVTIATDAEGYEVPSATRSSRRERSAIENPKYVVPPRRPSKNRSVSNPGDTLA